MTPPQHTFVCDLVVVSGGGGAGDEPARPGRRQDRLRRRPRALRGRRPARGRSTPRASWRARPAARRSACRGSSPGSRPRTGSPWATATARRRRERRARGSRRWPPTREDAAVPPAVAGRGPRRQVLRLLLRGHDREGHRAVRRRGLRLDRALQALHDRDDGTVPGPHVRAQLDPADRRADRPVAARGGHDDGPAAVDQRADGRAGRAPVRAGQALGDPRPPARSGRDRALGGRLAARLRLRGPRGRGAGGARVGGRDRRLDARQAARARAPARASCSTGSIPTASPTSRPGGCATA